MDVLAEETVTPINWEQLKDEVAARNEAGAAMAHIHVRDPDSGAPSQRLDLFEEVVERVGSRCNILLNLTTSGLTER